MMKTIKYELTSAYTISRPSVPTLNAQRLRVNKASGERAGQVWGVGPSANRQVARPGIARSPSPRRPSESGFGVPIGTDSEFLSGSAGHQAQDSSLFAIGTSLATAHVLVGGLGIRA